MSQVPTSGWQRFMEMSRARNAAVATAPPPPEGVDPAMWARIQREPLGMEALNYNLLSNLQKQTGFDQKQWQRLVGHFRRSQASGAKYLEGAGATAKEDARRTSLRSRGEIDQDLIDRGFYNSTLRDTMHTREKESLARTHGAIDESVRAQRLGFDTNWATTMGQAMAARPNPYAPLADIYRMALITRMTPKGSSPNFGAAGSGVGAGLGALVGSIFPGVGTAAGAMIGGGIGGGVGSMIH